MNMRLQADDRKESVLAAAMPLAIKFGYNRISREQIAKAAGVTGPALTYHFKNMRRLRLDLLRYAGACEVLPVIAQGLVAGEYEALQDVPYAVQRSALRSVIP